MDNHLIAQVSGTAESAARLGEEIAEVASAGGWTILLFVVGGALLVGVLVLAIRHHIDTN